MYRKDKARITFMVVVIVLMVATGALISMYFGKIMIEASERPTVHMVHGDQDTCVSATDAEGSPITCAEAMKDGRYHTEWNAPETLND